LTRRVAITGPESTGKSELSKNLANIFETTWVSEYAREYLNQIDRHYTKEDILAIARGQLHNEEEIAQKASKILFCDTDMIVLKIWSEFKYGTCNNWIKNKVVSHRYDLYLLCDIDLEWVDDPLREHPGEREELFNLYIRELETISAPYRIISGKGSNRVNNAMRAIEEELGLKP
jgi:NadR type nicotinamide-nucleotide adenylyltransferase